MPVFFSLDGFEVGQTFLRRRDYIKELATNRMFFPSKDLMLVFRTLVDHTSSLNLSPLENQFVISYIVSRYIATALHPQAFASEMFLACDPVKFVTVSRLSYVNPELESPSQFNTYLVDLDTKLIIAKNNRTAAVNLMRNSNEIWAEPKDLGKYLDARRLLSLDGSIDRDIALAAFNHLNKIFARTIENHRRERTFFREFDAEAIKNRVIQYEHELRIRDKR